jgi:hypothetical protein
VLTGAHEDQNVPCTEGRISDVKADNGRKLTGVASAKGDIRPEISIAKAQTFDKATSAVPGSDCTSLCGARLPLLM